ncbi:MAG: tetratricopeptide repeat protein [Ruminococcaceae bacterium]|nr:tetratricopeptide repeat protein [Oscillospiraceae bacterium]
MRSESKWLDLLDNEQHLIDVLLADEPLPSFPGDADSQGGRLYKTLDVVRLLMRGEYEEAARQIKAISDGSQTLMCHQLASIWLQAEVEDVYLAYQRLSDWIKASTLLADQKKTYRILVRQTIEMDRRLALRWAPVLRLYLTSMLNEWPEEVAVYIERDKQTAMSNQVSDKIIRRLDALLRLSIARQNQAVDDILKITAEWFDFCQENPEYGHGGEFILEAVIALEFADRADEALLWLERALQIIPERYELLLTKARLLKQKGDYKLSLKICDQLILQFPDDFTGYCMRSNTWFLQGQYDRAMADAHTAIQLAPDNPNCLIARAFVNMQMGQYEEALIDFRQTLLHDPQAYDALRGEGKCLSMLGRDQEALSCFNRLRRTYPDDPDIYYEMADVLFSAGYLDDCEKICRRCLQIDVNYVNAYVILGMIAVRRGEDDLARGLLQRAVKLEPDNPFALNELSYVLHLDGDDEQALDLVDQALAESDDYADAWCNKGMIQYYRSEFDQALASFSRAIRLAPDHVTAWIGRGNTLAQQCEFDEAQLCYDQALLLDQHSADACHGKALLYRILGLEDEVRKWQELALQFDPEIEEL